MRRHRTLDRVDVPRLPRAVVAKVTPDFRVAVVTGAVAIAALVVESTVGGGIHSHPLHKRLISIGATVGFLVFSIIAIRSVAGEMYRVLKPRTGPSHAGVIRWLITVFGCAVVLLTALGLLNVPVQHLLLGGALTGVIVGIAAQQALGNIFAGVVLLLARPFNVGDAIRMRAGALGGEIVGTVTGMGLTYVTVQTDEGPLSVPNSGVLASVIGPLVPRREPPDPQAAYPADDQSVRANRTAATHSSTAPMPATTTRSSQTGTTQPPQDNVARNPDPAP